MQTLAPSDPAKQRLLAGARALLASGEPADALPMLDRLALLPGDVGETALLRGQALLALDALEPAELAADTALTADPEAAAGRVLRARIRHRRGAHAGAIDDAAAAVMAAPAEVEPKVLLATCLLEARRFDEAIWFLGEALRARPGEAMILAELGRAFMLSGAYEAASEVLAHCAAIAPHISGVAGLRAQVLLLAGDAAGAEALARQQIAGGSAEAGLYSVLAHALLAQFDYEAARPWFAAAARLAPDDAYLATVAAATAEGVA